MKNLNKRGVSGVIVTVLMVLLVIAIIGILWVVIVNFTKKGVEPLDTTAICFDNRFSIESATYDATINGTHPAATMAVTIKKTDGEDAINSLRVHVDGKPTAATVTGASVPGTYETIHVLNIAIPNTATIDVDANTPETTEVEVITVVKADGTLCDVTATATLAAA